MASNLVEYYRNLAARGGTQAAMTSARPTRPALSPEVLERYESGLSRGSSSATGAATPTGTTTAPALTTGTSAPALTSFESLSTQPAITGGDLSGEGGISATDNLSGLSPSYGSILGENIGRGMATGMASNAVLGAITGTIAQPGLGTLIGAGIGAAKGAYTGIAKGLAESLYGFFMGDLSLDDLVGYSTALGKSEGLQNQVTDSFNLDASTAAGFLGGRSGIDPSGTLTNMAAESYGPGVLGNALASMAQSGYIGAANIYGALGGGSVSGNASNVGSNPGGAANGGDGGYGGGDVY